MKYILGETNGTGKYMFGHCVI